MNGDDRGGDKMFDGQLIIYILVLTLIKEILSSCKKYRLTYIYIYIKED